jgi:DNA-binding NarL/FixJ family response regulator
MDGYLLDLQHLDSFQKWILVSAGALTVMYLVMRPFKKRRSDPLAASPHLSLAGQREVERQMTELLVELEQMARQMTAQLDTKAKKLELLIKEADEKIGLLQSAGHAPQAPMVARAMTETAPGLATFASQDPRHIEVYELADAGQSARQIAQQLSRPQGEIELILALRPPAAAAIA